METPDRGTPAAQIEVYKRPTHPKKLIRLSVVSFPIYRIVNWVTVMCFCVAPRVITKSVAYAKLLSVVILITKSLRYSVEQGLNLSEMTSLLGQV
jgi:hypothetical protein